MAIQSNKEVEKVFSEVRSRLSVFSELPGILKKTESDGYFSLLTKELDAILRREISVAVSGWLTRDEAYEDSRLRDGNRLFPPGFNNYL